MQRKHLIVAIAAGLGLAGAIAFAANRGAIAPIFATAGTTASQASPAATGSFAAPRDSFVRMAKPAPPPAPPTVTDVGDVDSFGRNVRWLGGAVGEADVASPAQCSEWATNFPEIRCSPVILDSQASTSFLIEDFARISLPAGASNSTFCHWLNPMVSADFSNTSSEIQVSTLRYSIGAYVENPVLASPGLTNPGTGTPMNGRLWIGFGREEFNQVVPANTTRLRQTWHSSKICGIDNQINKRMLIQDYGLSQTQADEFFTKPTTMRLAVSGRIQRVDLAGFYVNLRIVGD